MQKSDYLTVAQTCENTVVVNKSRFITTLAPITSYDDAITSRKRLFLRGFRLLLSVHDFCKLVCQSCFGCVHSLVAVLAKLGNLIQRRERFLPIA